MTPRGGAAVRVESSDAGHLHAALPEPHRPAPTCLRCGFPVTAARPMGCKSPCRNCGTLYPRGDCSD